MGELARNKLSTRYVKLTSYSKMSVKLAAQTLSESVANAMLDEENPTKVDEMKESGNFALVIDRWFDCMNTRPGRGKANIRVYT